MSIVNALNPEVIVIGGGAVAAGDLLLDPAREVVAERALPPAREHGADRAGRRSGPKSGMLGAALFALDGARGVSGRLVVCPTPIGNLEDVTLRVLAALREADVVACEDTRRTRVAARPLRRVSARLVSYHEHNEERARGRARRADAGGRRPWRSCPTPACRSCPIPGYVLVRGVRGGRAAGRGAARAVGGDRRAGGVGSAGRRVALRGLPAPQEGRAAAACSASAGRDARGVRVAAPGARPRWPCSPRSIRIAGWRSAAS